MGVCDSYLTCWSQCRTMGLECAFYDLFFPSLILSTYQLLTNSYSSVPTVKDVQVPETLLKKNKADAKAAEAAATKKAELKKASVGVVDIYKYHCVHAYVCALSSIHYDDIRDQTQGTSDGAMLSTVNHLSGLKQKVADSHLCVHTMIYIVVGKSCHLTYAMESIGPTCQPPWDLWACSQVRQGVRGCWT